MAERVEREDLAGKEAYRRYPDEWSDLRCAFMSGARYAAEPLEAEIASLKARLEVAEARLRIADGEPMTRELFDTLMSAPARAAQMPGYVSCNPSFSRGYEVGRKDAADKFHNEVQALIKDLAASRLPDDAP